MKSQINGSLEMGWPNTSREFGYPSSTSCEAYTLPKLLVWKSSVRIRRHSG
jgi:hypothetical protein